MCHLGLAASVPQPLYLCAKHKYLIRVLEIDSLVTCGHALCVPSCKVVYQLLVVVLSFSTSFTVMLSSNHNWKVVTMS